VLFISVDNFDPTKKPFSIPLRRGLPKKLRVLGASPLSCKIHRMVLLEHTNSTLTIWRSLFCHFWQNQNKHDKEWVCS
jgi:hypothetical protein